MTNTRRLSEPERLLSRLCRAHHDDDSDLGFVAIVVPQGGTRIHYTTNLARSAVTITALAALARQVIDREPEPGVRLELRRMVQHAVTDGTEALMLGIMELLDRARVEFEPQHHTIVREYYDSVLEGAPGK